MRPIPFLRPKLVTADEVLPYLRRMDVSRTYSNFGPLNAEFESRVLREYFDDLGAVVTVSNATVGLMLAIMTAKRPSGRFAVMPSFTFSATAQAALWCGLQPYFVDVRPGDFCLDDDLVRNTVGTLGDDVAVVIPYAAFGTSCDLSTYERLHRSGVPVVVDAAASFGASAAAGQFGKRFPGFVVFSFHATKAFGIGEGGLVYSSNTQGIDGVRQASNFGFSAERSSLIQGLNGKLSEYAAAVGLATLDRFAERIRLRQQIYDNYIERFGMRGMLSGGWQVQRTTGRIPHQFMSILCPPGLDRSQFLGHLDRHGIQARTYFSPACHEHPAFKGAPATTLRTTDDLQRRIVNLPMWDDIEAAHVEYIVDTISAA